MAYDDDDEGSEEPETSVLTDKGDASHVKEGHSQGKGIGKGGKKKIESLLKAAAAKGAAAKGAAARLPMIMCWSLCVIMGVLKLCLCR